MNVSIASAAPGRGRRADRMLIAVEALVGLGVVVAVIGKSYGVTATVMVVVSALSASMSIWFIVRMIAALRDETLDVTGATVDEERERLEHEKMLLLQGIKELEADAATGKVDAADYQHLRQKAEARALEIIQKLRESDEKWARAAEKLVAQRIGAPAPAAASAVAGAAAAAPARPAAAVPSGSAAAAAAGTAPAGAGAPAGAAPAGPWLTAVEAMFDSRAVAFEPKDGALACGACGWTNDLDARFCGGCGRPRADAGAGGTP